MGAVISALKTIAGVLIALPQLIPYVKDLYKAIKEALEKIRADRLHKEMEGAVEQATQTGDTSAINDQLNKR